MSKRHVLIAAAFITVSTPAVAGITVLGTSAARMCYLAAEARVPPTSEDLDRCDSAIQETGGDRRNLVASHVNRGIVRMRRHDLDGALSDYDRAMQLNPNEPEAYLNRGSALLRGDRLAEALTMFSSAIAHNTRRPELAHYGRAMANELLGNVRDAYNDYRRASELSPNWDLPREELQRFRVVPRDQVGTG